MSARTPKTRLSRTLRTCAVLSILATTACAPTSDPDLGIREGALDVVYGNSADDAIEVDLEPVAVIPPPVQLPAPTPTTSPATLPPTTLPPTTTTLPPPDPCPVAPIDALPAEILAPSADTPPLPGSYRQAQTGTATIGGDVVDLAAEVIDTVAAPTNVSDTGYEFEVTSVEPATVTTIGYRVDADGLAITSVSVAGAEGVDTFTPTPALLILPSPAVVGSRFTTSATDPASGRFVRLNGRVTGIERIDVCGEVVDTWEVTFGEGPAIAAEPPSLPLIGNPVPVDVPSLPSTVMAIDENLTITGTAFIAPQLGGIVVGFDSVLDGTIGGEDAHVERSRRRQDVDPR